MRLSGRLWSGDNGAKHQNIIISFCNLPKHSDSGLLLFDLCCSRGGWLDLGLPMQVTSCTGICQVGSDLLGLVEVENEVYIVVISAANFRPRYYQPLNEVRDAHSICAAGDKVLVASTGTDEIVAYDRIGCEFRFQGIIWTPTQAKRDTHHVNSVSYVDDQNIWVTAFGPKGAELWDSANNGYIFNITRRIPIRTGINQPHSLRPVGRKVFYCESAMQRVVALDSGTVCTANGYTRGLCILHENRVIIGTSIGRQKSKSTGFVRNPADPGEPVGVCAITEIDLQTGRTLTTDMSKYGGEIYDIHYTL
jgi:Domain of unknown function (DUF4915)